jgi:hypothetical protein
MSPGLTKVLNIFIFKIVRPTEDPTVYEYDSIYDTMQEKKAQQVSATSSKAKVDKKVCYLYLSIYL